MDYFSDIVAAVQSDLSITPNTTLFPVTTVKLAINRAYVKIGGMYKWSATKDALSTSSESDLEYYDYPQKWLPNSIWKIRVDGSDMGDPLAFKDYLFEQENQFPNGKKTIWANDGIKYFLTINGVPPTVKGDANINIWGHKSVDQLVADTDPTIFSFSKPEVNEAIILEATAILKQKGEILQVIRRAYITGSELLNLEAKGIIDSAFAKEQQEIVKDEKTIPQWKVPDYFAGRFNNRLSVKNKIGNF